MGAKYGGGGDTNAFVPPTFVRNKVNLLSYFIFLSPEICGNKPVVDGGGKWSSQHFC